ncbi:GH3 auxin-responsive promoter [Suillus clintonianus]|uniref:GH3 auxin-responsive promoter n=1 Tax=Suillus clintonianus TaxID=1904413 RepID=UPI001B8839F5|nr:GH3 auxin-responsive promoter [Suillus clintonianus]KAG2142334.1 GH3 auxin-responsive promoter [Suillus clintonianus]
MSNPETDILDSLSSELSQQLKDYIDQTLLEIIRPNSASQFAHDAPELAKFREAVAQSDSKDDIEFLRSFREFVTLTNYKHYQPFTAKFFATPCKEADVKNMFAPGLPYFIAMSSMTSGNTAKTFPIYRHAQRLANNPLHFSRSEGSTLSLTSLDFWQNLKLDCEDGQKPLPVCSVTIGALRMQMNWDIEHDMDRLDMWVPGKTAPYAVSLVKSYRSFFVLNALFALADRGVTTAAFTFGNTFLSFLQYVEDEWDILVDCIEKGIIPDIEQIDHVREALEKLFKPNPTRAAELREIGPPVIHGWAVRVWPNLNKFVGITGGPGAIAYILGPSVRTQGAGYGGSEAGIAIPYQKGNPSTDFKIVFVDGVIEFLDVQSSEPLEHILSAHEVVAGGQYEPILTTRNGLWRYSLGDVITVKGFAPEDGLPIINYLHRRDGALAQTFGTTCSESQLTNAIVSAARYIGQITDFTIVSDDREATIAYGYLVEIGGEIVQDTRVATQHAFDHLMRANAEYRFTFFQGRSRQPTIRLVEKGTFTEYRRQKCEKTNVSMGQLKIPVVISDPALKEWFLEKVIMEL